MGKGVGMMARGAGKYQATGGGAAGMLDGGPSSVAQMPSIRSKSWLETDDPEMEEVSGLAFIPRQVPLTSGTGGGLLVFAIFLVSFTGLTMLERHDGVFFFAEHTRQLVGIDDFRRLEGQHHTYREYQQWFQYHFVDGLANVSTRLDRYPGASVVMVGPPRIRQIRYDPSGVNMLPGGGLIDRVYDDSLEDTSPFGRGVPDTGGGGAGKPAWSSGGQWHYQSSKATGDWPQSGRLNLYYSGAGYVLDLYPWLQRDSDELNQGSEFYPFAHWQVNTTDLWEMGWLDKQTKAILHDFTLYSASEDLFAFCRVTAEFEGNGAVFQMGVNLRVFWLERPKWFMAVQYTFVSFLLILILGELQELKHGLRMTDKVLVERVIELKYQLRLKQLQFAAEHGVPALYQPHKVLKKLANRLYEADGSCVHHIAQLNKIGTAIPPLQAHFADAMRMLEVSGMKGSSKVFKPNPVLKARLAKVQAELAMIRAKDSNVLTICKSCWVRIRCSTEFYFQSEWNNIDSINYTMLLASFILRMWSWSLMPGVREQVATLDRDSPYDDANYINTYMISSTFQFSFYINSFSSILTWLKLFKFLNFFPEMSIFTKTVSLSAQHLGVFFFVVLVVVIGSAQGFCLAFGADIADFRNPFQAVISVALYTVGKFNYDELVFSQRWFGPLLFWVYIFLVFFVMMSVFIAILSEGYEAAKAVIPATASGNIWEELQTVAVINYRESKQRASVSLRKVTGRNKVQDRWAAAGSKVATGVKLNGAMAAVVESVGKNTKRAYTTEDANILTDSESDGEAHDGDIAYRRYLRSIRSQPSTRAKSLQGRGMANLWMENSSGSDSHRQSSRSEPERHGSGHETDQADEEQEEQPQIADAEDCVVVPEALERLHAVEDQVSTLTTQHASARKNMSQLTKTMKQMGNEQAATLTNILRSLESVAATSAQPAQETGFTARTNTSGSSGQDHHRTRQGDYEHRHHSPSSPVEAGDHHDQASRAGAGRRGTPTNTSSRISPVRTKVPNMRQQLAAVVSAASDTSASQKQTKKIPSMREQMAKSVERAARSSMSSSSPPQHGKKVLVVREQMAASAERARSQSPLSSSARAQPEKMKVMSMRAQMEAIAAQQSADHKTG